MKKILVFLLTFLFSHSLISQKYIGVFYKSSKAEAYEAAASYEELKPKIKKKWDEGWRVKFMELSENKCIAVFEKGKYSQALRKFNSFDKFEKEKETQAAKGNVLIFYGKIKGDYIGIYSHSDKKGKRLSYVSWSKFVAAINKYKSYDLRDITFMENRYRAVLTVGSASSIIDREATWDKMRKRIKKRWGESFQLRKLEFDGSWIAFFDKNNKYFGNGKSAWSSADSWEGMKKKIKERWDDGYRLSSIAIQYEEKKVVKEEVVREKVKPQEKIICECKIKSVEEVQDEYQGRVYSFTVSVESDAANYYDYSKWIEHNWGSERFHIWTEPGFPKDYIYYNEATTVKEAIKVAVNRKVLSRRWNYPCTKVYWLN